MSSPPTRPLGRISSFFGLLGFPGGVAGLIREPPLVCAARPLVVAYCWLSLAPWLWSVFRRGLSAGLVGEFDGSELILVLSARSAWLSALIFVFSLVSCWLT